ncbi:MAG: DNA polymerase III subunit chi [Burkholderiales bacterium]|nr:DNA polymerase III subunit chi [Burkholderiales bacterium]
MTEVTFHFNVPDKVHYACRLLRKAQAGGARVGVLADADTLRELDVALWTFSAPDFVAHCGFDAPAAMRAASPIVLALDGQALDERPVLVHLGQALPSGFERARRLIELVSADPADREQARLRWRHYQQRGYPIQTHDAAHHAP